MIDGGFYLSEEEKEKIGRLENMSKEELIEEYVKEILISESSGKISRKLTPERLIRKYKVSKGNEAIELAYVRWGFNISYAIRPVLEYTSLCTNKGLPQFIDPIQKNLYLRDPSYIIHRYVPRMHSLYSKDKISIFHQYECTEDLDRMKDLFWIYEGVHIEYPIKDIYETYFFNNEIENNTSKIYTFGIISTSELFLVDEQEIEMMLESNMNFKFLDHVIDESAIDKLYAITESDNIKNSIISICTSNERLNESHKFLEKVDTTDFKKFIDIIFEIIMGLRGGKVNKTGKLPIESENTQSVDEDFFTIECQYTIMLDVLEKFIHENIEVRQMYLKLPLLYKDEKNGKFYTSNNNNVGTNIEEKLKLISNDDGDNSCIRLSSNYLLWTIWYYSDFLDIDLNIDINKMSIIS